MMCDLVELPFASTFCTTENLKVTNHIAISVAGVSQLFAKKIYLFPIWELLIIFDKNKH
jgi:hypothetical protein